MRHNQATEEINRSNPITWVEQWLLPSSTKAVRRRSIWNTVMWLWAVNITAHVIPLLLIRNDSGQVEVTSLEALQLIQIGDDLRARIIQVVAITLVSVSPVLLWMQFRKSPRIIQAILVGLFQFARYGFATALCILGGVWTAYFVLQQTLLGIGIVCLGCGLVFMWARKQGGSPKSKQDTESTSPAPWWETFAAGCAATTAVLFFFITR